MFTINDLRRYCDERRLNKIEKGFRNEEVYGYTYDDTDYPTITITGDVYDIENEFLAEDIHIVIDYEKGIIKKGYCDCRYIRENRRVCDHLLLLVYAFLFDIKNGDIQVGPKNRKTDYVLSQYLKDHSNTYEIEEKLPDKSGTITIKPEIQVSDYNTDYNGDYYVSASFLIGKADRKSYVIKNISEFQNALSLEKEYTLGKDFSVVLCMDSFDALSLPLASFLNSLPNGQDNYIGKGNYYNYYTNYNMMSAGRELTLTGKYLDDFMKACDVTGVMVYDKERGRKSEELYQIIDGKPNIETTIKKVKDGYEIECKNTKYIAGRRYIYTIDDSNKIIIRTKYQESELNLLHMIKQSRSNLFVSDDDIKAFTSQIYPKLEKTTYLKKENYLPEKYVIEKPNFEFYFDMPQNGMITVEVFALYGDLKFNALENNKKDLNNRNDLEEKRIDKFLSQYFTSFDPQNSKWAILDDEDKIYTLLTEGIEEIKKLGKVFISDSLKKLTIRKMDKVTVGVSVQSDLLQLDLNTDSRTLEDLADILSKYSPKKKYYRLKNGSFITVENDELDSINKLVEDLQLSSKDIKKGNVKIPKYRALYLENMDNDVSLEIKRDEFFDRLIQNISTVNESEYPIPDSIHATLREYQKKGYEWLCRLQENGFAGLLADEMGLGKTLQVITFIASLNDNKRKLVVCPASLVYNWAAEIEKFAPTLHYTIVSGQPEIRANAIMNSLEDAILITSYDSLKRDFEYYESMQFSVQVIDEAQYIKNANTQASQSVKEIHSSFRIALTGTPIENRLSELWSIFDFLLPGFLYRYRYFKSYFELPIVKDNDLEQEERLRNMIAPFILRRYKKDVLKDLPEKLEEIYYAPLSGEQKELYDARVQRLKISLAQESKEDFNKNKIAVLAELTHLRQICCSPSLIYNGYKGNSAKEDLCIDLIRSAVESGHKILLFSQFTSMLVELQERLNKEGISYYYLHGGTDKKERVRLVENFQKDDVPVFCISLKAGGTGLNLTAADIVIHYDPWWNTAVENQATDRTHRIGQDKVVTVYKLIMKDTLEERIVELQSSKADLAREMLSSEEMGKASFTKEQLLNILE